MKHLYLTSDSTAGPSDTWWWWTSCTSLGRCQESSTATKTVCLFNPIFHLHVAWRDFQENASMHQCNNHWVTMSGLSVLGHLTLMELWVGTWLTNGCRGSLPVVSFGLCHYGRSDIFGSYLAYYGKNQPPWEIHTISKAKWWMQPRQPSWRLCG